MAWEYSEKTKQLFMDAVQGKPGTHLGELENPDGIGEHGSIACGDALRFTFRTRRHPTDPTKDVITEARYLTFGCTSAIAASEALCCMIEGKELTPIEALRIKNEDIVAFLDGLPDQKIHCSVMGAEALHAAVYNWSQKRGVNLAALGITFADSEQEEGRIVCKCFTISEPFLKRMIAELKLKTIEEVTAATKAGGACMQCHHAPGGIQDLLDEYWKSVPGGQGKEPIGLLPQLPVLASNKAGTPSTQSLRSPGTIVIRDGSGVENLSPFQLAKRIEKVLENDIRPLVRRDGGDLELIDIKDLTVYVELKGACAGCAGATQTLKFVVEQALKENIDQRIRVIQV